MTSLIWTCVISFNVYMSVKKRKWFWKSQEADWEKYRRFYFGIAFILAFPGTLITIVAQHTTSSDDIGCDPGYEPVGNWYLVFFTELLPIVIGFCCNLFVFIKIRRKMSKTAFPLSVRKRRKQVMYYYITLGIVCWIPTIVLYTLEIAGMHLPILEIIARTSLYISGFLNFLVFGMQDPHLKRAMDVIIYRMGCYNLCYGRDYINFNDDNSKEDKNFYTMERHLKTSDVDKMVMFQESSINKNADKPKDKNQIYRTRKLSKEQKKELYEDRPDLDPKFKIRRSTSSSASSSLAAKKKKRFIISEEQERQYSSEKNNSTDNEVNNPMLQSPIANAETPLLQDYEDSSLQGQDNSNRGDDNIPPSIVYTYHNKTSKPKRSVDGDRELSTTGIIKIPTVSQPPQGDQSVSSSVSNSFTQSHSISVLSDLTNSFVQNDEDRKEVNSKIKTLMNVVNNDLNSDNDEAKQHQIEQEQDEFEPEEEEAPETFNQILENITNAPFANRSVNDSLVLHRRHHDDDENEGEGDEEQGKAGRKGRRYEGEDEDKVSDSGSSRSSSSRQQQEDESSEDEQDSEDEDLLNSPL